MDTDIYTTLLISLVQDDDDDGTGGDGSRSSGGDNMISVVLEVNLGTVDCSHLRRLKRMANVGAPAHKLGRQPLRAKEVVSCE